MKIIDNNAMKISVLISVICLIIPSDAEDKCKGELRRCLATTPFQGQGGIPDSLEEVNNLCRAYKSGMECVDAWNQECLPVEARLAAEKQMASAKFFMKLLCYDHNFKREYLNHTDCFGGIRKDWNRCHIDFLVTMRDITDKRHVSEVAERTLDLCCARYGFNRCISMASRAKCDRNAAVMLRRISETLSYNERCEKFDHKICSAASNSIAEHFRSVNIVVSLFVFIISGRLKELY